MGPWVGGGVKEALREGDPLENAAKGVCRGGGEGRGGPVTAEPRLPGCEGRRSPWCAAAA